MKNKRILRYIVIVLFCSMIDLFSHGLTISIAPFTEHGLPSIISLCIGKMSAAILWIVFAFSLMAYWYLKYTSKILGIYRNKGFEVGMCGGILWFIGMLESISLFDSTIIHEVIMGLCDSIPVVILCVLLSKSEGDKNTYIKEENQFKIRNLILSVITFAVIYSAIRWIMYGTNLIISGYNLRLYDTFLWTLLMGAYVGVYYFVLEKTVTSKSRFSKAVKFSCFVYGIPWISFLAFIPIVNSGTLVDTILRITGDLISVFFSSYLYEAYIRDLCKTYKRYLMNK